MIRKIDILKRMVASAHPGACLYWPFAHLVCHDERDGDLYAPFRADGQTSGKKQTEVSRVACVLAHGKPKYFKIEAAHDCGNGHRSSEFVCINPHHLRWDDHNGNMQDRERHGTLRRKAA